jgi:hypothetical protein
VGATSEHDPTNSGRWPPGGPLTQAELEIRGAAAAGLVAERAGPYGEDDMRSWGADRTVRATVLRRLLVDERIPVDAKGVMLTGWRITGALDLAGATVRCPVTLSQCWFDDPAPVLLRYGHLPLFSLQRCRLTGLVADSAQFTSDCILSGSVFEGFVVLDNAHIAGYLNCGGAQVHGANAAGTSLSADSIAVDAHLACHDGFTAAGRVSLISARLGANLNCSASTMKGSGTALDASQLQAQGHVFLQAMNTTAGRVSLVDATIAGNLSCDGATLNGVDGAGQALYAERAKVGGVVRLTRTDASADAFSAAGTVCLRHAGIGANLNCRDARLKGAKLSLDAWRVKVGGEVLLERSVMRGALWLPGATIGGDVDLEAARAAGSGGVALNARAAAIGGDLRLHGGFTASGAVELDAARIGGTLAWAPGAAVAEPVSLSGASAGCLFDDWSGERGTANGYWPVGGLLQIDGFEYGSILGEEHAGVERRLEWIRSQYGREAAPAVAAGAPAGSRTGGFSSQPYEQLASFYARTGRDDEARRVAIRRRRDLRHHGHLSRRGWLTNAVLDWTIRYGYETWRALFGLGVLYLVVFAAFSYAQTRHDAVVPAQSTAGLRSTPVASRCTSDYPCFSPAGYAVDTVLPLVNVRQADAWRPNANAPLGWLYVWLSGLATLAGWALATLAVAGYTGLVRSADPG